jgi:basic amino acid/polyamine antiporter, APA family
MFCMAEVASQFSEPGGPYLYVRTAFGRLVDTQTAWFHLLSMIGSGAANIALFIAYFGGLLPSSTNGWRRVALLTILIVIPVVANYVGVSTGASFTSLLTVAKLLPLILIICLGVLRFSHHFELLSLSDVTSSSRGSWLTALLLLVLTYGGFEDAMIPAGEVERPRHTMPFALLLGLLTCVLIYTLDHEPGTGYHKPAVRVPFGRILLWLFHF